MKKMRALVQEPPILSLLLPTCNSLILQTPGCQSVLQKSCFRAKNPDHSLFFGKKENKTPMALCSPRAMCALCASAVIGKVTKRKGNRLVLSSPVSGSSSQQWANRISYRSGHKFSDAIPFACIIIMHGQKQNPNKVCNWRGSKYEL